MLLKISQLVAMNHVLFYCTFLLSGCNYNQQSNTMTKNNDSLKTAVPDSALKINGKPDTVIILAQDIPIIIKDSLPAQLVTYAKSLVGVPYKFASSNPAEGFDCSGFITHVFNHFNITVPRSSVDFTNYGQPVDSNLAKPGDLILFTGTDSTIKIVGHMGIILSNDKGGLCFIHSTSGKAKGVTVSQVNNYYKSRFVKVIRVFNHSI